MGLGWDRSHTVERFRPTNEISPEWPDCTPNCRCEPCFVHRQIRLLSSQFLRQQLLLCDVHRCAVVSLKYSIFNHRKTNTTDVPYLPIGPNYSTRDIALAALLMHRLYCLRHARLGPGGGSQPKIAEGSEFRFSDQIRKSCRPRQTNRCLNRLTNGYLSLLTPSSPYEQGAHPRLGRIGFVRRACSASLRSVMS